MIALLFQQRAARTAPRDDGTMLGRDPIPPLTRVNRPAAQWRGRCASTGGVKSGSSAFRGWEPVTWPMNGGQMS